MAMDIQAVVLWAMKPGSDDFLYWRWRQHGPPKRWYPATSIHGVTTQRTDIWT